MKPEGTHVETYTFLTEDDDKVTPFTKVMFGQESPYIPFSVWGETGASLEGNSQPPVDREKE